MYDLTGEKGVMICGQMKVTEALVLVVEGHDALLKYECLYSPRVSETMLICRLTLLPGCYREFPMDCYTISRD
jgi:hypothetical protein